MTRRTASDQRLPGDFRVERGLSVSRLHRRADMDRRTVERIEAGGQGVSSDSIVKYARALTEARPDMPPVPPEVLFAAYQRACQAAGSAA